MGTRIKRKTIKAGNKLKKSNKGYSHRVIKGSDGKPMGIRSCEANHARHPKTGIPWCELCQAGTPRA